MQDDYGKMKESLVACANELKGGARVCNTGVNLINIMGDAGASFMTGLNTALAQVGPQYQAEVVGVIGRSYGEDKCMVPAAAKDNPQALKGLTIGGVQMDGDQNVCLYLTNANKICFNPDPTTYNPDCLNWMPTNTFVDAGQKYIQGYCEDRAVVKNDAKGVTKRTGETHKTCIDGVATWTPGDVTVVKQKGGLVSALSTRENSSQMAAVLIGIKSWDERNADKVNGILAASLEAGDQIKRGGAPVLMRASAASAQVFGQEDAKYWAKYYRGVVESDDAGNEVRLGGSQAFNLATAAQFLGLSEGSENSYAAAYTYFGNLQKEYYPSELPSFVPVESVLNLKYTQAVLAAAGGDTGKVQEATFDEGSATGETLAKRSWNITFQTGKTAIAPVAESTLTQLLTELTIAGNTVVEIHGHTDNTGNPNGNMVLSEGRARSVKAYLESKAPANFPKGRLKVVAHGQTEPVADNANETGRAANRRVEIILKSNQ
jgi:outer membrane protein OmpA-like peptidoglycan-associated protein